jgi:hypothetical protein
MKTLASMVIARAWIIECLYGSPEETELTNSVEHICEPFECSDDGERGNDDPCHPRLSSGDVDSPA